MSISYYDGRPKPDAGLLAAMMLMNAVFVVLIVLGWPVLADRVAAPIEWAMGATANQRLDLTAYPYATLWAMPALGCLIGWFGMRTGMLLLARIGCFGPALLLGSCFAWFYLTPLGWH